MMKENTPCFECGAVAIFNHHVIPRSQGGKHTVPLCATCHGVVHNRTFTVDYRTIIKDAMARAKARGMISGRKPKLTPLQAAELCQRRAHGEPIKSLVQRYGVRRSSIYRYLDRARTRQAVQQPAQAEAAD